MIGQLSESCEGEFQPPMSSELDGKGGGRGERRGPRYIRPVVCTWERLFVRRTGEQGNKASGVDITLADGLRW